jgi:hypothetical protein
MQGPFLLNAKTAYEWADVFQIDYHKSTLFKGGINYGI